MLAALFDMIEKKIELNRRMSATLEAMARALFKSWFVDFEPVRAKMEGRAPYLAPEVWNLFPDALDDEDKPVGWIIVRLDEIASKSRGSIRTGPFGSQLHKSDYQTFGTPVVMPTNLTSGEIVEDGIARVGVEIVERLNNHVMKEGDIVYGRRGDIGRKALVGPDEEGWLCGTGCLRISIRSPECPPIYLFHYLDRQNIREWIAARAIGATMPNLNTSILGEVEVLVPTKSIADLVVRTLTPTTSRIRLNRRKNKTLAALRHLLLPKLISGELRVKDAEGLLGRVL
jgi:type I restriction enzyme S subunit